MSEENRIIVGDLVVYKHEDPEAVDTEKMTVKEVDESTGMVTVVLNDQWGKRTTERISRDCLKKSSE